MLEPDTAADLVGLMAALANLTFSPEGSGKIDWSPNNAVITLNAAGVKNGTPTNVVLIVIDNETGTVSAKQGQVTVANLATYTP